MTKTEKLFKNINITNIQTINKKYFLDNFITGHPLKDDYNELCKNLPDLVDSLKLDGRWKDSAGYIKYINGNEYLLCQPVKGSVDQSLILGEARFIDNKLDWFRFSENAQFSRQDYLFTRNDKGYSGTLPDEDRPCEPATHSIRQYLTFKDCNGISIDFFFNELKYDEFVEICYNLKTWSFKIRFKLDYNDSDIRLSISDKCSLFDFNSGLIARAEQRDKKFTFTDDKFLFTDKDYFNDSFEDYVLDMFKILLSKERTLHKCLDTFEFLNENIFNIFNKKALS